MTDEEYGETQRQVVMVSVLVNNMDLEGFLERISLAHSAGPILNPTLYRDAMDNISKIESLANALRSFQGKAAEVLGEDGGF